MPSAFIPTKPGQIPEPPKLNYVVPPVPIHKVPQESKKDDVPHFLKSSTLRSRADSVESSNMRRQRSTVYEASKMSANELKIGTNLLVKPKLKVAGNVPQKEIKTEFVQRNQAVLSQIRNALNGVVVVQEAANPGQFNQHFAANKEASSRFETEEQQVTISSYDPDRF